jgi:hypothetical protein
MPVWAWIAIYAVFIIEMYIIKAPRSWKPWARRHDRARAQRASAYAKREFRPSHITRTDARTDRVIAAYEGVVTGNSTDPAVMVQEQQHLVENGLLDPDQPTPWAHYQWLQNASRDFTPEERMVIRSNFLPEATT